VQPLTANAPFERSSLKFISPIASASQTDDSRESLRMAASPFAGEGPGLMQAVSESAADRFTPASGSQTASDWLRDSIVAEAAALQCATKKIARPSIVPPVAGPVLSRGWSAVHETA
jgi:hypothetical protein